MTFFEQLIWQYCELLNSCIKYNVKVIIENDILPRVISTLNPRVLINILVIIYWPVLPNPPVPRAVSLSSSTILKWTGEPSIATNWNRR